MKKSLFCTKSADFPGCNLLDFGVQRVQTEHQIIELILSKLSRNLPDTLSIIIPPLRFNEQRTDNQGGRLLTT